MTRDEWLMLLYLLQRRNKTQIGCKYTGRVSTHSLHVPSLDVESNALGCSVRIVKTGQRMCGK